MKASREDADWSLDDHLLRKPIINSLTRAELIMNDNTKAKEGERSALDIEIYFGKCIESELL